MQWKKQAALVLAVCVLAQAVPFWALAEGEPLPGDEGQVCLCQAFCTQEEQNGDCPVCGVPGADLSLCQGQPAHEEEQQPAPTPAEAQEPQPEAGLLSAPQPRVGVTKEVRYLDGDGSEKTQTRWNSPSGPPSPEMCISSWRTGAASPPPRASR